MYLIVIFITAFSVRVWNYANQAFVVFDEVHIGKFLDSYFYDTYFFDVHPPFARLVIYWWSNFINLNGIRENWLLIGNTLSEPTILLRMVPIISSALLPVVVFLICRYLKISTAISILVSLFVVFENSLITQSRSLIHDNILILCGFMSLLFYLRHKAFSKNFFSINLLASILFLGFTISTKWSGLSFLALIILFELMCHYRDFKQSFVNLKQLFIQILSYSLISLTGVFIIYYAFMCIHLSYMHRSGIGDGYMSQSFQSTLLGNRYHTDLSERINSWQKFVELNVVMFQSHASLKVYHASASLWYTWPLMLKPIGYVTKLGDTTGKIMYIKYFGNPLLYWFGTAAIVIMIIRLIYVMIKRKFSTLLDDRALLFIILGYFLSYLPFMAISRTMFLYHYGIALIFSIMAIGYLIDRYGGVNKVKIAVFSLFFVFLSFLYFSPFTYGLEMTKAEFENRIWISTWR